MGAAVFFSRNGKFFVHFDMLASWNESIFFEKYAKHTYLQTNGREDSSSLQKWTLELKKH